MVAPAADDAPALQGLGRPGRGGRLLTPCLFRQALDQKLNQSGSIRGASRWADRSIRSGGHQALLCPSPSQRQPAAMNGRKSLRNLVLGAGGDAFVLVTSICLVLLVSANFESPASGGEGAKDLQNKVKDLKAKVAKLQSRLQQVQDMDLAGTNSGASLPPDRSSAHVYLRKEYLRKGGELVVEAGEETRRVSPGGLPEALRSIGRDRVILYAEAGVTFGRALELMDAVKSKVSGTEVKIATLKK
jgi:hypothetical protein